MNSSFDSNFSLIRRPLWTFPISDSLLNKLKEAGYQYFEDVLSNINDEELTIILGDTKDVILSFTKNPTPKTALELLKTENLSNRNITTFAKAFDNLLQGGIPIKKITELIGAPGSGKTQLCLQLCVSVQLPECIGGLYGSAIYVETNSNFSVQRINEMFSACINQYAQVYVKSNLSTDQQFQLQTVFSSNPLNHINKFSVSNLTELRASIFLIQAMLDSSVKNIKLIIIDSLTFLGNLNEPSIERTKMISMIMNQLNQLASTYHLAVVVTNEMTTCIYNDSKKEVIPSLGETFAHSSHHRLLLSRRAETNIYNVFVYKSCVYLPESANFLITLNGIRDISTY